MNLPEDFRNREFTRTLRGYNIDEVEEYIEQMLEKYDEIFKENIELKEKLASLETLVNKAKKSGGEENRVFNASDKAKEIIAEAEAKCAAVAAEYKKKVDIKKLELERLKSESAAFKASLLAMYEEHIKVLENVGHEAAKEVAAESEPTPQAAAFNPPRNNEPLNDEQMLEYLRIANYDREAEKDDEVEFLDGEKTQLFTVPEKSNNAYISAMDIEQEPANGKKSDSDKK